MNSDLNDWEFDPINSVVNCTCSLHNIVHIGPLLHVVKLFCENNKFFTFNSLMWRIGQTPLALGGMYNSHMSESIDLKAIRSKLSKKFLSNNEVNHYYIHSMTLKLVQWPVNIGVFLHLGCTSVAKCKIFPQDFFSTRIEYCIFVFFQ